MLAQLLAARRHRVTLFEPGPPKPDGEGGYEETEQPLDPPAAWCSIEQASDNDLERIMAGTVLVTASHILELPYHAGVTTDTRVRRSDGREYEVNFVRNVEERNITLQLVCSEVIDG
jgi:SPP1 family predicted phage head-tail adaptor